MFLLLHFFSLKYKTRIKTLTEIILPYIESIVSIKQTVHLRTTFWPSNSSRTLKKEGQKFLWLRQLGGVGWSRQLELLVTRDFSQPYLPGWCSMLMEPK